MVATEPSQDADAQPKQTKSNARRFITQGAIAHQAWVLSSPSVVMPFIAISLNLPVFLAGSLVAFRHAAGTFIDVFAVNWLSKARNRKRMIVLADIAIGLSYVAFVFSLFWDNKIAIGIAFTALLLVVGAIHEVKTLLITPFFAENLSAAQRIRVQFLQVLIGGIGAISVVLVAHHLLAPEAALTRHALVVAAGAGCFILSGFALMSIRDVAIEDKPTPTGPAKPDQTPPTFFQSANMLVREPWFRKYILIRLLFVVLGLSVPIFALVTAVAHNNTPQGLTALVVSSAAALTISAPLWRLLNGYSYRLSMVCGTLLLLVAGLLLIGVEMGVLQQPLYFHATAVFIATASAAGLSGTRSLYFMEIAPKDQLVAAFSVTKSIARFAIIGVTAVLAGLAHAQGAVWAVALITASALLATVACILFVPPQTTESSKAAGGKS